MFSDLCVAYVDIIFECPSLWVEANIFWRIFHKGSCIYHGHNFVCCTFLVSSFVNLDLNV